jgi:hypothetical protein
MVILLQAVTIAIDDRNERIHDRNERNERIH